MSRPHQSLVSLGRAQASQSSRSNRGRHAMGYSKAAECGKLKPGCTHDLQQHATYAGSNRSHVCVVGLHCFVLRGQAQAITLRVLGSERHEHVDVCTPCKYTCHTYHHDFTEKVFWKKHRSVQQPALTQLQGPSRKVFIALMLRTFPRPRPPDHRPDDMHRQLACWSRAAASFR